MELTGGLPAAAVLGDECTPGAFTEGSSDDAVASVEVEDILAGPPSEDPELLAVPSEFADPEEDVFPDGVANGVDTLFVWFVLGSGKAIVTWSAFVCCCGVKPYICASSIPGIPGADLNLAVAGEIRTARCVSEYMRSQTGNSVTYSVETSSKAHASQ